MTRLASKFSNWAYRMAWLCAVAMLSVVIMGLVTLKTAIAVHRPTIGGLHLMLGGGALTITRSNSFMTSNWFSQGAAEDFTWWFSYNRYSISGRLNWTVTIIPLWAIALLPGAAAGVFVRTGRRIAAAQLGKCRACGYSLDGLAPNAACPECGATSR